jgi:hypothetical protein
MLLGADRDGSDVVNSASALDGRAKGGCDADPERMIAPVSASHTTTLQDCVDESTPATSVTRWLGTRPVSPCCIAFQTAGQRAPRRCSIAS